jgi:hypothetical protein
VAQAREPETLWVALEWIEAHCVVPDGFHRGEEFTLYPWQAQYLAAFYLVRGDAEWIAKAPLLGTAFVYRRGLMVGPQKLGKNPMIAAQICLEGVGPALFGGWAGRDAGWACADHGCRCGWEYAYRPGEPMGMTWRTPLIQITAFSEESTENTYDALRPMIEQGPLADRIPHTGEEFIRLPNAGRIDTVTSSAPSRLGQRITFAPQDEVGIWTKRNGMTKVADTQYRGLAGMGGRASLTSNAWDPNEQSVAQQQYESSVADVYRQFVSPPKSLSYANKVERRKIHRIVYPSETLRENGGHIDLEAIEAEAADLAERDEPQAARFFGNLVVAGAGKAFDLEHWRSLAVTRPKVVPDHALITAGFDGSRQWDATALIATEVASGYQWPLGIWERPVGAKEWEVPADEVDQAVVAMFGTYDVWRLYCDPPYWETDIARWAGQFGDKRVVEWFTARRRAMAYAVRAWAGALSTNDLSHCAMTDRLCGSFSSHVANAVRRVTGLRDDSGDLWVVEKDRQGSAHHIDSVPAAVLSWEARNDCIAAGALATEEYVEPVAIWGRGPWG